MVLENILLSATVIIGLIGVAIAILERGYKTYLEKKAIEPNLKFNSAYLLNILISGGTMVGLITVVLPIVLSDISNTPNVPLTLGAAATVFIIGYGSTYRFLDGLNNSTEKRLELQEVKEEIE